MESANKKQIPLTICGFHLQFADYTYSCGFRNNSTYDTKVLSIVCGFHKLFWIPQIQLRIPQICLFLEQFRAVQCFRYLFVESKTAKKIKEKQQFCGFHDKSDFWLLRIPLTMQRMH